MAKAREGFIRITRVNPKKAGSPSIVLNDRIEVVDPVHGETLADLSSLTWAYATEAKVNQAFTMDVSFYGVEFRSLTECAAVLWVGKERKQCELFDGHGQPHEHGSYRWGDDA